MQAIVTKYHPPTNHKGARVSATCDAGRIVISYAHELDVIENHERAASELCRKLEWSGQLVSGQLPDGRYAHVFAPSSCMSCGETREARELVRLCMECR